MTPERWRRLQELFEAAEVVDPRERSAFLARVCPDDVDLRRQVESLLIYAGATGPLGEIVHVAIAETEPEVESLAGQRAGAYRLERELGQGGMGTVYLATRADDEYKKEVAVKLLRSASPDDHLLARFRAERQILAGLEHPNIARLLDGGTTERGVPFLVMEYVAGQPITEYCDERRLTTRARLKLFQSVCDAVQHAHRNLVVHRDLKPSNVLVTAEGVPKLLDFGIAKLLGPDGRAAALTRTNVRVMTPEYASPEQVRGEPITTASDVYSLGVVLYELLAGHRPYRFDTYRPGEIEKRICEEEPQKPSTAACRSGPYVGADGRPRTLEAKDIARDRGAGTDELRRELAGDLDNIILTALRKSPAQRYPSVEHLAEDLRRSLGGLPVRARAATFGYRASKFVRRHRVGVGVATAFGLVVVGSAIALAVSAARLARERNKAVVAEQNARRVASFLTDLFKVSDPGQSRGETVTAREILDRGAAQIDAGLGSQPLVQASLLETMGDVYHGLGLHVRSAELFRRALDVRRRGGGGDSVEEARGMEQLASELRELSDYPSAEALLRRAVDLDVARLGPTDAAVGPALSNLGLVVQAEGRLEEAETLFRRAVDINRKALGPRAAETLVSTNNLALLLKERAKDDEAEPLFRETLRLRRETLGADHPLTANSLHGLAAFLEARGRTDEAAALYREALGIRERVLGVDHPDVANTLNNLASLLQDEGRLDEAERLYRQSLAARRKAYGDDHLDVAASLNNLASLLESRGDLKGAEPLYRESLAIRARRLADDHPSVARARHNLGRDLAAQGRRQEGEALMRAALEVRRRKFGPDHPEVAASLVGLAASARDGGDLASAERLFREALAIRQAKLAADHPLIADAAIGLADVILARGRTADASQLAGETIASLQRSGRGGRPSLARAHVVLGSCLAAQGRRTDGIAMLKHGREVLVSFYGPASRVVGDADRRLRALGAENGDAAGPSGPTAPPRPAQASVS